MIWDAGFQSLYLQFKSTKASYISELELPFSTSQMSYNDVCPGFIFMNLFCLLYIYIWKTILADLTFKKLHCGSWNSILQVNWAVNSSIVRV